MMQPEFPLILASGSPRRRELLDQMGLIYTVDSPNVDENFVGRPAETVLEISRRKAAAGAARHPDSVILAADTLVFADEPLLLWVFRNLIQNKNIDPNAMMPNVRIFSL